MAVAAACREYVGLSARNECGQPVSYVGQRRHGGDLVRELGCRGQYIGRKVGMTSISHAMPAYVRRGFTHSSQWPVRQGLESVRWSESLESGLQLDRGLATRPVKSECVVIARSARCG